MVAFLLTTLIMQVAGAQQLSVTVIDRMPDMPAVYHMLNWKQVALGYDSIAFDQTRTGTYLPLVWTTNQTVNYPANPTFGLNTVVGTTVPTSAEAINCLPALVSATLNGVDKTAQYGANWVLMSQEWFNNRPSQYVYKNHPVDDTGDDWWYETMPNVFFYELNSLYPGTGDAPRQFGLVANQWLQSVRVMGGSDIPWRDPNMMHRGWYLQSMTPYDDGVLEPEASGAIAWLLYSAWTQTGNVQYREGAEWGMEFLNSLTSDPSYELQLSYGIYTAARMNAELETNYDMQKMVNWAFDIGPLRTWGAMTGTWGSVGADGLIGEVNGSDNYAFSMNTFEQIGALVPMTRYDTRFAREIGKWTLNAANAARLFYPKTLPPASQDSWAWSSQYDSSGVICHEALRQSQSGATPFATGDAITGGWGNTTLTLYSASHAGILGAIIDTTNVAEILKLDVLKTDYYHAQAYPTYLMYNPYGSSQSVQLDAGAGSHDLYDAASHTFVARGVSGLTNVTIAADSAVMLVVAPAGGTVTYHLEEKLINGVVADYHSGHAVADYPPRIKALAAAQTTILRKDTVSVYCTASDRDGDSIQYVWTTGSGTFLRRDSVAQWVAPDTAGTYQIQVITNDRKGGYDTARTSVTVVAAILNPPVINGFLATPRKIDLGAGAQIKCYAVDPDSNALSYAWSASNGAIAGSGSIISWTAPGTPGNYYIRCQVSDGQSSSAVDSIGVEVRDLSHPQTGNLLAYYSFNGNTADGSGNGHNGTGSNISYVSDHTGVPNDAIAFNGTSSYIDVPNAHSLNVQNSISVNFWMYIEQFFTREQYPISHGSWQNRWKVSISNQHLRWTIKTTTGTKDLDSETLLQTNINYDATATYDGTTMELWLNGALDAFAPWTGAIDTTTYDLSIGEDLPANGPYTFDGNLDEVHLYDYALSTNEITQLAGIPEGVARKSGAALPTQFSLAQNYPNPFNPSTIIEFAVPKTAAVSLIVYNVLGQLVADLVETTKHAGYYRVRWDATNVAGGVYFCRLSAADYHQTRKLVLIK